MTQPSLQFKQRHGFTSIEELTGNRGTRPVATDCSPSIRPGNACTLAQGRDEGVIQVCFGDAFGPATEQELNVFTRFGVDKIRLSRAHCFPGSNCLPNQWINGLGKCTSGLVNWNIEQTNWFFLICLCCFSGSLHPCAANPQACDLITA